MKRNRTLRAVMTASALSLALVACGSDSDTAADATPTSEAGAAAESSTATLTVSDAWSREPAEGQDLGVVYGTVTNAGDADVRIVAATSSVSGDVQIHETTVADDGAMSMSEVADGVVVPAGATFVFEPGGPHIMLLGIDAATFPTDAVDVVLEVEDGDPVSFSAPIRSIGEEGDGTQEMDHSEMDDSEMDHSEMDDSEMDHSDG